MSCSGCTFLRCFNNGAGKIRIAEAAYESLSLEEQHDVKQDLYGSGAMEVEETPMFVERKLEELERKFGLLGEEAKKYYAKAIDIEQRRLQEVGGEAYVGSKKFRLQFLRTDEFDASLAAKRLAEYFYHKFILFGEEKLARRIGLVDLNDEEKEALVSGALTFTGQHDFAGRPVFIERRSNVFCFSVTCIQRLAFYVIQKMVEGNDVAQRKGIVMIAYRMRMPYVDPSVARKYHPPIRMIEHALPVRSAAVHVCYDDIKEHILLNFALVLIARKKRARVLIHFKATHLECMLDVMKFGINPEHLPFTDDGSFKYEQILSYWGTQAQLEEESHEHVAEDGECHTSNNDKQ